jgi:hypothetical protein
MGVRTDIAGHNKLPAGIEHLILRVLPLNFRSIANVGNFAIIDAQSLPL